MRALCAQGKGPRTFTIGRLIYCLVEDWNSWMQGVAVVGGLLASQALTLFVTPVIYVYMENFSGWLVGLMPKRKPELHSVESADQPSLFGINDDIPVEPQKTAAE